MLKLLALKKKKFEKSFRDTKEFAEVINYSCRVDQRLDLFTEIEIEEIKNGISHEMTFAHNFTFFKIGFQFEQLFVQFKKRTV